MPAITPPGEKQPSTISFIINFIIIFLLTYFLIRYFFPDTKSEIPAEQGTAEEIAASSNVPIKEEEGWNSDASAEKAQPADGAAEKVQPADGEAEKLQPSTAQPAATAESESPKAEQWVALGSMDSSSKYKMLLTFTSKGAALAYAELNSPQYLDLFDKEGYRYQNVGYLGNAFAEIPAPVWNLGASKEDLAQKTVSSILMDKCVVAVVPAGTPAQESGLQVGDVIVKCNDQTINNRKEFQEYLKKTSPGDKLTLSVTRDGKELKLKEVALRSAPMAVIRPEEFEVPGQGNPLSFLLTIQQIDNAEVSDILPAFSKQATDVLANQTKLQEYLNRELPNVNMRNGVWDVVESSQNKVVFRFSIPRYGLDVYKTFELVESEDPNSGYHVNMTITFENVGKNVRKTAYRLDGPTGLPLEGYWYTHKVWTTWSGVGLRDMVYKEDANKAPDMFSCQSIAQDKWEVIKDIPLAYTGVDAAYFGSYLIPEKAPDGSSFQFARLHPLRVGSVDPNWPTRTNCSFRAYSQTKTLEPGEKTSQTFSIYIGPRKPEIMKNYGVDGVVYYGWFGWIAVPLTYLLHFFYMLIPNYGIAILLLTVVVRLALHPLSRKQVIGALKMQKLQPEMAKIKEKYSDPQEQMKAQQELFRKHNYNPLSGCLVLFIQLPIFMALYRALMVDVELRQASLFGSWFRFCSNLAAPDMLLDWTSWAPSFITSGCGFFGLGPYLNLLPIATIALFLIQQKVLMPPPADDQARMQQRVMTFMMVFMGFMFFKVAAGLCIYFIASSLWGLAERRFMPKELVDQELVKEEANNWKSNQDKKPPRHRPEDDEPMNVLKSWGDALRNIGKPKEDDAPQDAPRRRRDRKKK
ncbi:MAG: YidC/Oxa1 family insertase periplasmic-domain containing protein [Thermoguttaceae bacterium]|nr:YidC/Oxa1 family insertase periplasmic-domain containing protein [Thermoguttaceae bacterium]